MIDDILDRFATPSRRDFLRTSGRLVVGFTATAHVAPLLSFAAQTVSAQGAGPYPDLDFRQLDSWFAIPEDNTATV
ncbi:MAG: hypothetical protein AB7F99_18675, partial [Vicinamibacterales bacterium]